MTSFDKCIAKIRKAGGEDIISDEHAMRILKSLTPELTKKATTQLAPASEIFQAKLARIIEKEKTKALIDKRNAMINIIKHKEFMDYASNFKNDANALKAMLVGVEKPIEGARDSIASRQQALFAKYLKGLINEVETDNLLHAFNDKSNSRDIAIEYVELNKEAGNPGRTNNTEAVKIAKIIKRYSDDVINRMNNAGTWITDKENYLLNQSHDMNKIRRAGYEKWKNTISPLLDIDAMFEGMPDDRIDSTLKDIYLDLASGNYLKAKGEQEVSSLVSYKGPGGLAKRLSLPPILKFLTPESWVQYDTEFGGGSTQGAIIKSLERASKNIALMEKLGPDPKSMLQKIANELKERNRDNPGVYNYLDGKNGLGATPENLFKELTGENNIVQNVTLSRIASMARGITSMASLGGSLFSQIPDIAVKASELRYQGRNPLVGYVQGFFDVFEGLQSKDKKRLARALGAGYEGILHEINGRLLAMDPVPGAFSSTLRAFFKLTGMEYWNDSQKMGFTRSLSAFIAEHSDDSFSELDPHLQNVLGLYSITDKEWNVLRIAKQEVAGYDYITPDAIRDLTDDQLRGAGIEGNDSSLAKFRVELETQYRAYLTDRADHAIATPGPAERAVWNRGTQPGTLEGELLRTLSQFKMFSTTIVSRVLPKEFHGSAFRNIVGFSQLIVGSTILGYLGMSMRDISQNKTPKSLEHAQTWADAFLKGGALGLYGDYLFENYNQYGHSLTETLSGPTFGRVDTIAGLMAGAIRGDIDGSRVFSTVKNNAPFLNIFYIRAALDYLILYQLQEQMEPGFINKMSDKMSEDYGQSFILEPNQ